MEQPGFRREMLIDVWQRPYEAIRENLFYAKTLYSLETG